MVDSNFRAFYEHDQNEAKHHLSLSTHGAGPLTEDGRWVLLSKVGEAAGWMGEEQREFDEFDQGVPGGEDLPDVVDPEAAEGIGDGSQEG